MDISGEYRIGRSRAAVWAALNDPAILAKCIPGCDKLERTEDGAFDAIIAASIGPVRARFATRLRLENLDPPASYTLTGESKSGPAGFARGSADVRLEEVDGGTLLRYRAGLRVGGKLAQVGSRLVAGATRKTADEFFACFAREVEAIPALGAGQPEAAPGRAEARANKWLVAGAAAAGGLLGAWILLR